MVQVFRHSLLNSEGHVQDALECTHRAIGGHLVCSVKTTAFRLRQAGSLLKHGVCPGTWLPAPVHTSCKSSCIPDSWAEKLGRGFAVSPAARPCSTVYQRRLSKVPRCPQQAVCS